jgi:hypothetical protein
VTGPAAAWTATPPTSLCGHPHCATTGRSVSACALERGGAGRAVRRPRPAVMVRAWGCLRQLAWRVGCMVSRPR